MVILANDWRFEGPLRRPILQLVFVTSIGWLRTPTHVKLYTTNSNIHMCEPTSSTTSTTTHTCEPTICVSLPICVFFVRKVCQANFSDVDISNSNYHPAFASSFTVTMSIMSMFVYHTTNRLSCQVISWIKISHYELKTAILRLSPSIWPPSKHILSKH
jgi:hypothetical protein